MRKVEGLSLAGFIKRVKAEREESCSLLVGWRPEWEGLCEEFWSFGFIPASALEAIEEKEGLS